jgi:DNA invertase Pin-like site-specific DNA recombinase
MESQQDTVRRYVTSQGGEVVGNFCEVESGGKTDEQRPELAAALNHCRKTKSTLIVAKLDRLSRNALFLLQLQSANVDFICADCPNVDRFTVGILALVAEKGKIMISERTKAALQMACKRGVKLGTRTPERQVRLMVEGSRKAKEEFRAKVMPIIREIKNAGVSTLQGVCDCLNARGVKTRTGKTWFPTTVKLVTAGNF